jgi:2-polyprenyl-3-methyl-5-hydroxy-6-metoxy-1,4-benzoquinol methylase
VGRIAAVAGDDDGLAGRLRSRGYGARETPHFAVWERPSDRLAIVVHGFGEATVDEDLPEVVAGELGPLGLAGSAREFGDALFAIVASTCPPSLRCPTCGRLHLDDPAIWRHYCLNTLARLGPLLDAPAASRAGSHVAQFAAVYRRILTLRAGASVLDVGSNLGLLPVVLAARAAGVDVVGCDNRAEAIACAADLAAAAGHADRVRFRLADVLAPDFPEIGRFDMVTAVHVLEHLPEDRLPAALANLLRVTAGRLVVAVPYEETAQPLYGHEQVFTPEKLRRWGSWCVERGGGRSWCEDVSGGLLVVEPAAGRSAPPARGART